MSSNGFNTPILLLLFNRLETTKKVVDRIKEVRPNILFLAADGPRSGIAGEAERCEQVRRLVLDSIDWPCEVKTLFRDNNLGCGKAVSEALTWFFQHVEYGIILEDDTLPGLDFFPFQEFCLKKYKFDDRIFSVNGCSLGYHNKSGDYGATRYFNMWGWGTWRRSIELVKTTWSKPTLDKVGLQKNLFLGFFYNNRLWFDHWYKIFIRVKNGDIDTWDYQFIYTALVANKLSIRPNRNLVINLGYGVQATHTHDTNTPLARLTYVELPNVNNIIGNLKTDSLYDINFVGKLWNGIDADGAFFKIKGKLGSLMRRIIIYLNRFW